MESLKALWRGDLSLAEAFWTWAVLGGLLVNLAAGILALILISHDLGLAALLVGKGISLPYNLAALVGVWRAAARQAASALAADLARGASLVLMMLLSLT